MPTQQQLEQLEHDIAHARWGLPLFCFWLATLAAWWALAFVPVDSPPAWLATARSVCFGALENGLPDTYGWMALILGPVSMLAPLMAIWGKEITSGLQSLTDKGSGFAAVMLVVLFFGVGSSYILNRVIVGVRIADADFKPASKGELTADYPEIDKVMPELSLVDQHGNAFTNESLKGQPSILTFAFGHCATICPVIVHTAKKAAALTEDLDTRLVVVTLDPWRDTPGRLPHMQHHWELTEQASVLSGEVEAVESFLDTFGVARSRDETSGDVTHAPVAYVLSADGDLKYGFNNPTVEWLVEAVRRAGATEALGS